MTSSHTMYRRVLFHETDASSLLHFTNTLRYMEDCEHEFLRELGVTVYASSKTDVTAWPRVDVSCRYFAPIQFDDEVAVRLLIKAIGKSSLTYQFQIRHRDNDELCALGHLVTVYVNQDADGNLSSRPLPLELTQQIACAPDQELWHE